MKMTRFLFVIISVSLTICGAFGATVGSLSESKSVGGVREKRAVFDVNVLLRSLLQKSAELSNFKANVSRSLATIPPPTRPPPPPPPPTPMTTRRPNRPNPRGRVGFNYGFGPFQKGAFINFNYGDYDVMPPPARPTQAPTTTTSAPPPPRPPPQPQPQRPPPPPQPQPQRPLPPPPPQPQRPPRPLRPQRPIKPVYGPPGLRFANSKLGRLPAYYDDYYDDQPDNDDADYQNEQAAPAPIPPPPPPPPPPASAPRPQNVRSRARPGAAAARPQLRNNLIFQYAQPDDTSSDGAPGNDGDIAGAPDEDVGNNNDDNNNNNNDSDPGSGPPPSNDDVERPQDQPPPNLPNASSQKTQFFDNPAQPPSNYGFGSFSSPDFLSSAGSGAFPFNSQPPIQTGSFQFRSPFADFKTTYDGTNFQPSQYVSQAQGFYH